MRARVTARRIARIRRAVERALPPAPAPLEPEAAAATARAHVAERRAGALAAIAQAASAPDPARWHRARLDLKRWRYAAECVRPILGADAPEARTLGALKQTQEALGRVQDLEVLRDLARRRAERLSARGHADQATVLAVSPTRSPRSSAWRWSAPTASAPP